MTVTEITNGLKRLAVSALDTVIRAAYSLRATLTRPPVPPTPAAAQAYPYKSKVANGIRVGIGWFGRVRIQEPVFACTVARSRLGGQQAQEMGAFRQDLAQQNVGEGTARGQQQGPARQPFWTKCRELFRQLEKPEEKEDELRDNPDGGAEPGKG